MAWFGRIEARCESSKRPISYVIEGDRLSRLLLNILILAFLIGLVLLASCSEEDTTAPPLSEPPTILSQGVFEVNHQGGLFEGWIDNHGRSTVCWFDYGKDISFGARTPNLAVDAMEDSARVEYRINWLDPETLYWWRFVAVAGTDTVFASETTFTTMMQPNEPPNTHATFVPHEPSPVHFYWTGSDVDGVVAGYRWRLSDNGLSGVDVPDTLGLPWNFTTVTDSFFAVSADVPMPREPGETGPRIFFRPHTFWIKAVDNLGLEDPSPYRIAFTTFTEAPEVLVTTSPSVDPNPDGCLELPLPITFTWAASDSDSPPETMLEVRTLLVNLSDLGIEACLTREEYEELDPLSAVDESMWSEWQEYDPQSLIQPTFVLGPQHQGGRYLFAAIARDGAGAWTDELAWGANVWQVEVLPD